MVLKLELNLERDKTGDVGKFHGLDTFDDGYVDGIYSLKLNQEAVHMSSKKGQAIVNMY